MYMYYYAEFEAPCSIIDGYCIGVDIWICMKILKFHEKKQIFLDEEKEALRLSDGVRLTKEDISFTPKEIKGMEKVKQKDDEEMRKKYGSIG